MCNIAGYVGTKKAAPILIDMIRRQEGLGGGYYTGIATICDGVIHYAKLTGDTKRLLEHTNARSLPGTIGIIHSRSKSGGGDEWAHPFVGIQNGKAITAYVANGAPGFFDDRKDEANRIGQMLFDEGYTMLSKEKMDVSGYTHFTDGEVAHTSDVMCQLITKHIVEGRAPAEAMNTAFCEMPSEIVGLLLSLATPDCITWSRIDMPMNVSFTSHGAYLATAAMEMPEDAGEATLLPACSGGNLFRDRLETIPYVQAPASVAPLTAGVRHSAYNAICEALSQKEATAWELVDLIRPFFVKADCLPDAPLMYDVLHSLKKEGRLCITEYHVPGSFDGIDAPQFRMKLK